ncbi:MAG TPA: hypothetical protein VFS15_09040 [Kofleriaceae bacterium]|nr:hypothetical protein [Kofleriaceae bacterium]
MSTRTSPIAALPALLLVVVACWEVCSTPREAASVPSDHAWEKAAAVVRADHEPGDLIVFAPDWVDPVGRLHLGDLIPIDMAARMDAARYGRIWELSIRGARSPDTAGLAPVFSQDVAGITVRRFERTPVTVVADVRDALPTARVQGPARPTLELAEVGFAPHRCIQVIPPARSSVRITFPQLPLGSELVGYAGLADIFTRRSPRGPGKLAVEIGGKVVAEVEPGVDDGWVRFAAPTTPGPTDVTFIASADDPNRLICFAAEARK